MATESLRKAAKFDAKANWETAIEDLDIMNSQLQAPLMIMGLKNPGTFVMIDHGRGKTTILTCKKSSLNVLVGTGLLFNHESGI